MLWRGKNSLFIIHDDCERCGNREPVKAHPVIHVSRRGNSFCRFELIQATAPMHKEMNSVGRQNR